MKRLLLLLPLLALGSCRDNGASVQIQTLCAFSSACSFSGGKCGTESLGNPRIDPSITKTLKIVLQLENQLTDNTNADLKRTNTNDAHVDRVEVQYGGIVGGKVTLGVQGDIPAGSTGLVYFDVIPTSVGATLAAPAYPSHATVSADVRFSGYFDDGTRFETATFPLTIEVSTGSTGSCSTSYCPQPGQSPMACGT